MLMSEKTWTKEEFTELFRMVHLPVLTLGGTSGEQLRAERIEAYHKLLDAWTAMMAITVNGRDYACPQHLTAAQESHKRRLDALKAMMELMETEVEWVTE